MIALLTTLSVVALLQPTAARLGVAVALMAAVMSHEFLAANLDGFSYYASAALASSLVIAVTSCCSPSRFLVGVHKVCVLSILVNFAGWAAWWFYLPPLAYNVVFTGVYLWALYIFCQGGLSGAGMGLNSVAIRCALFFSRGRARDLHFNKNGGKV